MYIFIFRHSAYFVLVFPIFFFFLPSLLESNTNVSLSTHSSAHYLRLERHFLMLFPEHLKLSFVSRPIPMENPTKSFWKT